MTKKHETYYRDNIDKIVMFDIPLKGELTIVISPKIKKDLPTSNYSKIEKQVKKYAKKSYTVKDIIKLITKKIMYQKKLYIISI